MKKSIVLILLLAVMSIESSAQKYSVASSKITFFSSAPIEDIEAHNEGTRGILDLEKKTIAFSVPISEFVFEKSLMQEHFNEKYMESERYPRSTFSGTISDFDLNGKGEQKVEADGNLEIHGISRRVNFSGTMMEDPDGRISISSKFNVKLEDHDIDIPSILWQNIAEVIEVTVQFTFKKQ